MRTAWLFIICASPTTVLAEVPACPVAVVVHGDDAALREDVNAALREGGVVTHGIPGCSALHVDVQRSKAGVVLRRSDRDEEREVSDASVAASLAGSWAHADVTGPFLPPEPTARPAADVRPTPTPLPTAVDPVSVGVALGALGASDGSVWAAAGLDACVRVGPLCVGLEAIGRLDTAASGASASIGSNRGGLDVLAQASLPLRSGRFSLAPSLGLGAGWMRSGWGGPEDGSEGETIDIDAGGPRLETGLRGSYEVRPGVLADLRAIAMLSPVAHTSAYREDAVAVAGEPVLTAGGWLGIRFGAP